MERSLFYKHIFFHQFLHNRNPVFSLHIKVKKKQPVHTFVNTGQGEEESKRRGSFTTSAVLVNFHLFKEIFLYKRFISELSEMNFNISLVRNCVTAQNLL